MRVLLVGAGAVGQVYGRHLAAGGAQVTYFVREKYLREYSEGFAFYHLNSVKRRDEPSVWNDYALISNIEEISHTNWDQVWLCVSSTAIRAGWLGEFLSRVGEATIVSLQPGLEDREFVLSHVPKQRLVSGMIGFISYPGPLPGESLHSAGMVYWFPLGSPSYFSGPKKQLEQVMSILTKGKLPAKKLSNLITVVGFPTAILMPVLMGLESESWSFDQFKTSSVRKTVCGAIAEAMSIVAQRTGGKSPWWRILIKPWLFRILLGVAKLILPLPIEPYLKYHFTKVGDQTRLFMATYERLGEDFGLETHHLRKLRAELAA